MQVENPIASAKPLEQYLCGESSRQKELLMMKLNTLSVDEGYEMLISPFF